MSFLYFICSTMGLILFSCSPIYYAPNAHNVPVLKEKGDIRFVGAMNDDQQNFQGAYAITDHIGCQINTVMFDRSEDADYGGGSGNLVEGGVGYYDRLSRNFVFECYGLAATGKMENHFILRKQDSSTHGRISAHMTRYGIQPSIAYTSKYFEVAFSPRLSHLRYSDIAGNLRTNGTDEVMYLKEHGSSILFEPALTIRAGFENIKLQFQSSQSHNKSHPDFPQENYQNTIGICLMF